MKDPGTTISHVVIIDFELDFLTILNRGLGCIESGSLEEVCLKRKQEEVCLLWETLSTTMLPVT